MMVYLLVNTPEQQAGGVYCMLYALQWSYICSNSRRAVYRYIFACFPEE